MLEELSDFGFAAERLRVAGLGSLDLLGVNQTSDDSSLTNLGEADMGRSDFVIGVRFSISPNLYLTLGYLPLVRRRRIVKNNSVDGYKIAAIIASGNSGFEY